MKLSPEAVARLTVLNTLLSFMILFLLLGQLLKEPPVSIQQKIPSKTSEQKTTKAIEVVSGNTGQPQLTKLLEDTITPLRLAIADHHDDSTKVLPSDLEVQAAIESGDLGSDECQKVLKKLEQGYDHYNMPFPNLMGIARQNPEVIGLQDSREQQKKKIQTWIKHTLEQLRTEAKGRKELSNVDFYPSKEEVDSAIESASFDSKESQHLLELLKRSYAKLNLTFPDPKNLSSPSKVRSISRKAQPNSAEQQIVQAYFKGQLQRIHLEARKKNQNVDDCKPEAKAIAKAVSSGDIASTASTIVLKKLEKCYDRLGVPFFSPVTTKQK